ncbi:hypothetical protein EW145_g4614 [Phellinidium pouzarii]|uniref:Uncharacterized protein n=1 Tax=Phellinidium pouzarii TaxID=167371 RepID=A0A4S4L2U9_9AGAM|nr:hypothetical protein EW145_g4614 [Phellinidium pouzarii]
MVLDLFGHNKLDGTPVIVYGYNGGQNQQWRIIKFGPNASTDPTYWIVSVEANTVIQMNEGLQMLQAQTRRNDASQSWRFEMYPSSLSRKLGLGDNVSHDHFEMTKAINEAMPSPVLVHGIMGTSDDDFSMVNIAFKNTGEHTITMNIYDSEYRSLQNGKDIHVANNLVRIMRFRVNETYNFVLKRGRMQKNFSETFSKATDIDVEFKFILS